MIRKLFVLTFIFIILSFYTGTLTVMAETKNLKEGFYKVDNTFFQENKEYTVQNNSFSDRVFVIVFDTNDTMEQALRLNPQSSKYSLIPLKLGYKIVIVGNSEISFSH